MIIEGLTITQKFGVWKFTGNVYEHFFAVDDYLHICFPSRYLPI